jgi:hypothetical protein
MRVVEQVHQRVRIRATEVAHGPQRESEGFIVPIAEAGQHNLLRGKGPCFDPRFGSSGR